MKKTKRGSTLIAVLAVVAAVGALAAAPVASAWGGLAPDASWSDGI